MPLVFAVLLAGCTAHKQPEWGLEGQEFFLCCNIRFNNRLHATDANYGFVTGGITLPVGTRVTVIEVDQWHATVRPRSDRRVPPSAEV